MEPLTPSTTSVDVEKVWKGDETEKVTVDLLADGEKVADVELSDKNNWKHTFTELPVVHDIKDEKAIEYTVEEVAVDGYETAITGDAKDGFTITNTQVGKTEVSGIKTWKDDGADDRPESITVKLFANDEEKPSREVAVTAENNWKYSFTDLPKYDENGKEITYTVKEEPVDGYQSIVDGYDITNVKRPTTPTNSGQPENSNDSDDQGELSSSSENEKVESVNKLPQTGEEWLRYIMFFGVALMSVGGILIFSKRKKA
ncbi:hypothetical protein CAI16_17080 [Virgibacillus dokdonensis]|uniref:Gram-positive cocci surface proteins LPxTG domain-containing protein n=2 Tax=Virgibacillus dokdonensis TaxID=302167 RepID=A0A3E0WIL4_9BACI|nr:hypothetical protein CAI16_17080 [Virgibacillus dokdonensis]